ncbi:MAG TPA: hypothetical protein VMW43_11685 [Bacteroidota bacterium]|nr:hypothetical protein [Bacteroidota bacterium]
MRESFFHTSEPAIDVPRGMSTAVERLQQRPAALHVLYGHSGVYTGSLLLGCAAGGPLAVIDGATRFNSYTVARIAQALSLPVQPLLRRTHITRAFTAFQLEAAVTTKLTGFLRTVPCPLVILLGPLHTYYDEQVTPQESRRSLDRLLGTIRTLTAGNTHVLAADVRVDQPPPGKKALFATLCGAADVVAALGQDGLVIERTSLPPYTGAV